MPSPRSAPPPAPARSTPPTPPTSSTPPPPPPKSTRTTSSYRAKEAKYQHSQVRSKFAEDGTCFVQGKEDPLSNMWPVEIVWQNIKFQSSSHVYVFEMLKWHKKLTSSYLHMFLMCQNGFQQNASVND